MRSTWWWKTACLWRSNERLAQCINYLKVSGLKLALLINFRYAKAAWRRVVHEL